MQSEQKISSHRRRVDINENLKPNFERSPSQKLEPGKLLSVESTLPCCKVEWKLFDFAIYHNWHRFGSSHTLFRHSEDFRRLLSKNHRETMQKINSTWQDREKAKQDGKIEEAEKLFQEVHNSVKQGGKKMFTDMGRRYSPHFVKTVNNSRQTFILIQGTEINIYFRRDINDQEQKFWKAACSDGTRENIYESDGLLKLITHYALSKGKEELESYKIEHWYIYGTSQIITSPNIKRQGIFVQLNEDSIDNDNGILLKLYRDNNAEYQNKSDDELKKFLKNKIGLGVSGPTNGVAKRKKDTRFSWSHMQQPRVNTRAIDKNLMETQQKDTQAVSSSMPSTTENGRSNRSKRLSDAAKEEITFPKAKIIEEKDVLGLSSYKKKSSQQMSRCSSMSSIQSSMSRMSLRSSQQSLNLNGSIKGRRRQPRNGKNQKKDIHEDVSAINETKTVSISEKGSDETRSRNKLQSHNVRSEGVFRNFN